MARVGGFSNTDNTIYLNVYDLHENNSILYPWGLGFYHSGVQIGRNEYTFAGEAGIFFHEPKGAPPPAKFRETIPLGTFKGTTRDLEAIIQSLRSKFSGNDYHILNNNCNSFANEFCLRLLGKEIPGYVNRMANIGSYFSCLLPENAAGSPVNDPSASNSAGANTGFYSKPGRLASHSAGGSGGTTSALHENKGVKLGGSGSADVVIEDHRERRERMRQAATKRFSSSSNSSSAQL
eukprot:gene26562-32102_t